MGHKSYNAYWAKTLQNVIIFARWYNEILTNKQTLVGQKKYNRFCVKSSHALVGQNFFSWTTSQAPEKNYLVGQKGNRVYIFLNLKGQEFLF